MTHQTSASIVPIEKSTEVVPAHLADSVKVNIEAARSVATRKAYRGDWQRFTCWCEQELLSPLPASPATIAAYATALGEDGKKVATIQRALVAISQAHKLKGHPSPTSDEKVHEVLKGIKNRLGVAQRQARPILPDDLRAMVRGLPETIRGVRDRAMLTVGFAGAFRRSELVALNVDDLEFVEEGVIIMVRRSKTDQAGVGHRKGIPYGGHPETCPVRSLRRWIETSKIDEGPVFVEVTKGGVTKRRASSRSVGRAVKRAATAAGLDPRPYSAHSLRAGLVVAFHAH